MMQERGSVGIVLCNIKLLFKKNVLFYKNGKNINSNSSEYIIIVIVNIVICVIYYDIIQYEFVY